MKSLTILRYSPLVVSNESPRELFLMSPPGPDWELRGRANFRSDRAQAVDPDAAFQEWVGLARAIEHAGGWLLVLPPSPELTGLPYCAEAGHPLPPAGDGAKPRFLLPRMSAPHRRGEKVLWGPFLARSGFEVIEPAAGLWEGQGDVATFRGCTLLFFGGRTDRSGLDAIRSYFPEDSIVLETRQPAFHGNVAVLPIDHVDRLIVCPDLIVGDGLERLEERFGRDSIVEIRPDEARNYCTNALPVGHRLLAPTVSEGRVLHLLRELGMEVVCLPMQELCEKAGGASRCLVCRVPADLVAAVPGLQPANLDDLIAERSRE